MNNHSLHIGGAITLGGNNMAMAGDCRDVTTQGIKPRRDTQEQRDFWDFVEKVAADVETWPAWKKGGASYAERIRKIKTHTCHCGNKLRGNDIQCGKCREGKG